MVLLNLLHVLITALLVSKAAPASFIVNNKCRYSVWPGVLSGAGSPALPQTGFELRPGESTSVAAPSSWSGRLWARTLCTTDSAGIFLCSTGDCGSGKVDCDGGNAASPATLAEFTLSGAGGLDFYDVSLVDGFNLPMLIEPRRRGGGSSGGNCSSTGCVADMNVKCPSELRVSAVGGGGSAVACKSACGAFGRPEYCCSGAYNTPSTCSPSAYSLTFKAACPSAYSYAYDDSSSTFTCAGSPDYVITFCPASSTTSKKASEMFNNGSGKSGTTVNTGGGGGGGGDGGSMFYEGLNTGGGILSVDTAALWRITAAAFVFTAALVFRDL